QPGDPARRAAGARAETRPARKGDDPFERPRAPYPDRAAFARQPDHPRGSVAAIRHLARTGAPDRGARLRKIAEGNQSRRHRAPSRHPLSGRSARIKRTSPWVIVAPAKATRMRGPGQPLRPCRPEFPLFDGTTLLG